MEDATPPQPIVIRLVVGGNAILACANAHVLVYADTKEQPTAIIMPPRARWLACVAEDFPVPYEQVMAAIVEAGFVPKVSPDAAVSSSSGRG